MSKQGIYYLIAEGEIVYVGKSVDIFNRVQTHKTEGTKAFDQAVFHTISDQVIINATEVTLIGVLSPKFNRDCKVLNTTVELPDMQTLSTSIYTISYDNITGMSTRSSGNTMRSNIGELCLCLIQHNSLYQQKSEYD